MFTLLQMRNQAKVPLKEASYFMDIYMNEVKVLKAKPDFMKILLMISSKLRGRHVEQPRRHWLRRQSSYA